MADSDEDYLPGSETETIAPVIVKRKPGPKGRKPTASVTSTAPSTMTKKNKPASIVGDTAGANPKMEVLSGAAANSQRPPTGRIISGAGRKSPPPLPSSASSGGIKRTTTGMPQSIISRKKQPPLVQRVSVNDSDEDVDYLEDQQRTGYAAEYEEEESDGAGIQIAEMLNQLGSELKHRMNAKRRRIQECFESVKQSPNVILETLQNHSMERGKVIQKFQQKSNDIKARVEKVYESQKETEEKLSKMMLAVQKHFDSMKDSLNNCVAGLKEIIQQFDHETEELQGTQDQDSRKQLDAINQELTALQKKILRDGSKEEAESIRNTLNLKNLG